jgi:predicted dehydrogenase
MTPTSRRFFLSGAPAAGAGAFMIVKPELVSGWAPAKLKVGLIGCGGRGTQAAGDMLKGDPAAELVAMGDIFEDRLEGGLRRLRSANDLKGMQDRINVQPDKRFVGFDNYKKVINSGVDVIMLATPPGWRPIHFEAAIEAGKHVFCEKPFGTDCVGVQRFMKAARLSEQKKLTVVSGAQRRSDPAYLEKVKAIQDGAIGDLRAMYAYWVGSPVIHPVPPNLTVNDFDFQHRRWYSYLWLCGDQIVEQHLHNIDVCNWIMGTHPVRAIALGGANFRPTKDQQSNIFDHLATDFEYPNGVRMSSYCRQYPNPCAQRVNELIIGTKDKWTLDQTRGTPGYVNEHTKLYKSIRGDGPYVNEAMAVAESTMTCIMGREAGYSGLAITWDMLMNSKQDLMPREGQWDYKAKVESTPLPIPGIYKFI